MSTATPETSLPLKEDPSTSDEQPIETHISQKVPGPRSPFELPEILSLIAACLAEDKNTLRICCRVSKAFNCAFTSVLFWLDLVIQYGPQGPSVPWAMVKRHAALVRTLSCTDDIPVGYCTLQYPNLRHFVVQANPFSCSSHGLGLGVAQLIQNHADVLQSLKVSSRLGMWRPPLWGALAKLKKLQELVIVSGGFDGEGSAVKNARVLSNIVGGRSNPVGCSLDPLVREINQRRPCWPQLVKLHFPDCGLEDDRLDVLLSALNMCPLEDIDLSQTLFGFQAYTALMINHAETLRYLDLQGCKDMTSLMLHSILCSLPWLVSIKGEKLLATDLWEDERDWVCDELQFWNIEICMDKRDPDHCCQVFLRLSSLSQLQTLILSRNGASAQGEERTSLPLQVDLGMELLQSLSQLEVLQFDQREVQEKDWDCILESFERLKNVVALEDKTDDQRRKYLKQIVDSHKNIAFTFCLI